MTPGQLFAFRPVPGYARYRTPIRGPLPLRLGRLTPGGGVMGTPGPQRPHARSWAGEKLRRAVWHRH